MRILHTSDWHLGRPIYGRKRYQEFETFLDWLAGTIEHEKIDALLVAGDIFDTSTPGNRAQELYYRFLCRVAGSCCGHVVIIAGNHDSPSFLNAPRELLRALDVHVVGAMTEDPEDEVIPILTTGDGTLDPEQSAIICAVPYLRDRDVRTVAPGESIDDKNRKLVEGIRSHYAEVVQLAEQKREEILRQYRIENQNSKIKHPKPNIPIIAMGHLFTAGGRTVDGDGVRELYVGSLVHTDKAAFPPSIDYLALGHLHVSQAVGGDEHMRYSGSPIPMGFGEADQEKSVVIVDFRAGLSEIRLLPVPSFQQLVRISGSLDDIFSRLATLKNQHSRAWLEIDYSGDSIVASLRGMLDEAVAGTGMEILRIKNRRVMERVIGSMADEESLDDLDPAEIFSRCLDAFEVPEQDREELMGTYREVLNDLAEDDGNVE